MGDYINIEIIESKIEKLEPNKELIKMAGNTINSPMYMHILYC